MGVFFPKIALFFSTIGFLAVGFSVQAVAPFTDDFDSYPSGNLSGQGSWQYGGQVVTDPYQSAPNSATANGSDYLYKKGSKIDTGEWYFYLSYTTFESGLLSLKVGDLSCSYPYTDCAQIEWVLFPDGHLEVLGQTLDPITSGSYEWHVLGMRWQGGYAQVNVDGGEWTIAADMGGNYIEGLNHYNTWEISFHVDGFTDTNPTPPVPIAGDDPVITPTFPANTTANHVDDITDFNVSGSLTIPASNLYSWDSICISFTNVLTPFETYMHCEPIDPPVPPDSIEAYSFAVVEISSDAYYKIAYRLIGHGTNGQYNSFDIEPDQTFLTEATSPPSAVFNPSVYGSWEMPAPEDCSTYDLLPKLVCEIKNTLVGIFIPSRTSLNELQRTFAQLANKLPFNYISAVGDTIAGVRAGLVETSGIQVTMFGNTGIVDLSFWEDNAIGATIKIAMMALLLLGFVFYAIKYLNRIF